MNAPRLIASRRVRGAAVGMTALLLFMSSWSPGHATVKAVVTPPPPYIPVYNLIDLGMLSGDTDAHAYAINASGAVTGASVGSGAQAFRYSGSTMTGLGVLTGGDLSEGTAINSSGEVAGVSGDLLNFTSYRGVTWTGTTIHDINPGVDTFVEGINDAGDVVGLTGTSTTTAFLDHSGTVSDLNSLVTSGATLDLQEATAINTSGQIVGDGTNGSGRSRAFLFNAGALSDLGVMGTHATDQTVATAVNDAGHIAGFQFGSINDPFFWDGAMHDLGKVSGYPNGSASGINASDWVVGEADKGSSGPFHAFVWAPGDAMVDLNTRVKLPAGWVLEFANAINDAGVIVGTAQVNGGHRHAFRLTPSNVTRIAGSSRYDTAAKISAASYTAPQATVYIATGDNFPDALAGAALAGGKQAPLLLVPTSGTLPTTVITELQRLAPTNIVIFGGTGAVSDAMLANIHAAVGTAAISRIAGGTRYDTAAMIAATYTNPQATVYIATGANFPDALAGAALAGGKQAPLLLVPTNGVLPSSVTTELGTLAPTTIVIFGGTGAVATSVELQVAQY